MRWRTSRWVAVLCALALPAAHDGRRSAVAQTFDVKTLEVEKGKLELSLDNTFHRGVPHARGAEVNRHANDLGLDYGIASFWRLSGIIKLEKPESDEPRLAKIAAESLLVLRELDEKKSFDWGLGWFASVEASIHRETTNATQFGPILAWKADKLSLAINPFIERTFGRNAVDGFAAVYGWQLRYELRDGLVLGVEGFGYVESIAHPPTFDAQEHRAGPAVFTEIPVTKELKISADVGVLLGLTRATPDAALKLNVGVPLHIGRTIGRD